MKDNLIENKINFRAIILFIMVIMKPFKISILIMVLIAVVNSLTISLRPYFLKLIINGLEKSNSDKLFDYIFIPIFLYLTAYFVQATFHRIFNYFVDIQMYPKLSKRIMDQSLSLLMQKSYNFYQDNYSGALSNKINDLKNNIPTMINLVINSFCGNLLTLVVAIFTLWQVNIKFATFMCGSVIIFVICSFYLSKNIINFSSKSSAMQSSVTGKLVDLLSNILAVHLFASKRKEMDDFKFVLNEAVLVEQKLQWNNFWVWFFYGYSFFIIQLLNFYFLYQGRKQGIITIGDFALVLTLNLSIIDLLWQVGTNFSDFSKAIGAISQSLKTLGISQEIQDVANAKNLIVKAGHITFDDVRFHYTNSEILFDGLTISINPGEKVGLVGYSGSGKTTFVNLILRLYNINGGTILIDDQDINNVKQDSLLKNIAIIPQDPGLFHRSLMENIRYGKPEASDDEVIEAAKKADAHDFIMGFNEQYNSLVGERGIKLSGGQRQRIAIARAILKNARILILDEATSQLDSVTENIIQESLWKLMEGKTTLVIAHRLSTLLNIDRILVFNHGNIVEDGNHKSLLEKNGLYKILWESQIGGFLIDNTKGSVENNILY